MDRGDEPNDELLDRATRAMAGAPPTGDFPQREVLEFVRGVAGRRNEEERTRFGILRRIRRVPPLARVAASVLVGVCLLGLGWAVFHAGPALAFSSVVRQLHDARTMTADVLITQGGVGVAGRVMFAPPGRLRVEFDDLPTQIADMRTGRVLVLDRARRVARVEQISPGDMAANPAAESLALIDRLRNLSHTAGTAVGEAEVNGARAQRFNATVEGQPLVLWADAATGAPLRIQAEIQSADGPVKVTIDHLVLGGAIDEGVFGTDVPEGYVRK